MSLSECGRLQDCFHAAAQALGEGVDARAGGQVILDLRVIWLSGVWEAVHQRYLASKPLPVPHMHMAKGAQSEQQAA